MNAVSQTVSTLALAFLEQTLQTGGTIEIPSLGITIKPKEACPKCKSTNTSSNGAGMWHCWACDHSWRGKDY